MPSKTTKVRYKDALYVLQGLSDPSVAVFVWNRVGDAYDDSVYALRRVAAEYADKVARLMLRHVDAGASGDSHVNCFAGITVIDDGFFNGESELGNQYSDIEIPVVSLEAIRLKNVPGYVKEALGAVLDSNVEEEE